MDESNPPEHLNPLQRFGRDVRQVRQARKLTQEHLGKAAGYSYGYVSMVETGKLLASEKFAEGCDLAFGTGALFSGLLQRIDEGDHPSWFVPYLNLERKASRILNYSANLVTGMLQTEEYARVIFRVSNPIASAEAIEGKVAARLRRREVFESDTPPFLWVILHEACLRTVVGGAETMAGQLEYLLAASASPYVDLQVMPFSAGAPVANAMMPFTLLKFTDSPTVLYSDGPQGGKLYDSAKTVASYVDIYDRLRAHALSPDGSLNLIESLLEEYRNEHRSGPERR
ncbi:helix-turn-helix domain-containing protein [Streptomyces sp. P1-3]|uniref:helix-turn-helix domain-containing protein n=1 Tax=Streptomyces sp. P1-3 TaxID=3421658 RepID=UPI003D35F8AA